LIGTELYKTDFFVDEHEKEEKKVEKSEKLAFYDVRKAKKSTFRGYGKKEKKYWYEDKHVISCKWLECSLLT